MGVRINGQGSATNRKRIRGPLPYSSENKELESANGIIKINLLKKKLPFEGNELRTREISNFIPVIHYYP